MSSAAQYTGHLPGGDPVQAHSAGPDYPAVIYGIEFEQHPGKIFYGVLLYGFDYGVFRTHADAQRLVAMVKGVRTTPDPDYIDPKEYRKRWERALATFLDEHRAARAGVIPSPETHPVYAYEAVLEGFEDPLARPAMSVDNLRTPILARMRWGYSHQASMFLRAWGYNPDDFLAFGELAPVDDGTRVFVDEVSQDTQPEVDGAIQEADLAVMISCANTMANEWAMYGADTAAEAGWGLVLVNAGVYDIVSIDDDAFTSDEAAEAYVIERAELGDISAVNALAIVAVGWHIIERDPLVE
jgi:hypothetical protein